MRNDPAHCGNANRLLIGALAAIAILLSHSIAARAADENVRTLLLGVHPYLSYGELQNRFLPLAHYLAKSLGMTVKVRVGRDYAEHVQEVGHDRIDIAYLGPISYVHMVKLHGSKPLLARLERDGKAVLVGHIVVPEHSPLQNVAELRGRAFAFGDPESTMSSVVPQAVLAAAGISLNDLSHYANYRGHSNVALAVLSGQMDAGAVKSEIYDDFSERGLRSLTKMPEVSEHLFVARADMPPTLVEKIRMLLLGIAEDPEGMLALKALHRDASGLVAVTDQDYDALRSLLATTTSQGGQQDGQDAGH